uniref:Endonuclease V n=1 Tax=Taeniopygia guttata TaxID=59729 RepID=A0A674H1M3_TAEGU
MWPGSWPSERSLCWWKLCRDFSRRSPSSSLRCAVFPLSRAGLSWLQSPGEGVLPPVPELLGQEGHGQSCAGASIPFPWGAGMWSWEQPGRPWCVQGTASPTLLLLQGQAQAGRALQGELRNQERFLLPPEPEALLAPWSALSAQEITFLLCFFQVLLVDGNGLLHPRGFGIACHLGVLTDLPCIGVAKNLLHVDGLVRDELHREQVRSLQRSGETLPLTGTSGKVLGMVLRSCSNSSRPLYVSVGHRVSLGTAVRLVRACCRFRVPEPIRQADIRSREYLRKQPCAPVEVLEAVPASPESSKKEAGLED